MRRDTRIAVIYGSTREGRLCDTVAGWVVAQLAGRGRTVDVIDPAGRAGIGSGPALRERIDRADAFIVVTPEYNHSFPAPLKSLIDRFNREWRAKPVAFVSYGGASGGLRAVEHLRAVFAELHAVSVRDGVMFPNVWDAFDAAATPRNRELAEGAMATLLARLDWWTAVLREAREARDHEEIMA